MLVEGIEEVIEGCLYAVRWEEKKPDSYMKMLDELDNDAFLKNYLTKNEDYLFSGYYQYSSIESAIQRIKEELYELIEEMIDCADRGPYESRFTLRRLFSPLDDRRGLLDYTKGKAKSSLRKPVIRIYGYKMDDNCMIISGYGIKLVPRMQDHPDLMKELEKLNALDRYIEQEGILTWEEL